MSRKIKITKHDGTELEMDFLTQFISGEYLVVTLSNGAKHLVYKLDVVSGFEVSDYDGKYYESNQPKRRHPKIPGNPNFKNTWFEGDREEGFI